MGNLCVCVRLSNLMKIAIPSTSPIFTIAGEEEQEHSKIATSVVNLWVGELHNVTPKYRFNDYLNSLWRHLIAHYYICSVSQLRIINVTLGQCYW